MTYTRRTKRNCALQFQFRPACVLQIYSLRNVGHIELDNGLLRYCRYKAILLKDGNVKVSTVIPC
jgi:hypothetical protein